MHFSFNGDGKGFRVEVSGNWRQIMALVRAAATAVAVVIAVRMLPQLVELVRLLGL